MISSAAVLHWFRAIVIASAAATFGVGCTQQEAVSSAEPTGAIQLPPGLKPAASLLDLMAFPIDQYANDLWGAVATVSTEEGSKDIAPTTDEDWNALRQKALVLMESANLLVIERPVAHPGQKLRAEGGPGDYTPQQAQDAITKEPAAFAAFAAALHGAAGQVLAAIDARDVDKFLDAGSVLQEACEACHKRFWYPDAQLPPAP